MSAVATKKDVTEALAASKETVRVLGVVPFDVDWDEVCDAWARGKRHPDLMVRLESDNIMFTRAFVSDSATAKERQTFQQMRVRRNHGLELSELLVGAGWDPKDIKDSRRVELLHLGSPLAVVRADSRVFAQLTVPGYTGPIEEISERDPLWEIAQDALAYTFDDEGGQKFSAPLGTEVLEIFDHQGVPRGAFPRNSFYDTDYTQLVVWVLILDRQGRLLIHRRADNAKDNRGMWDKSVGGHVDPNEHADTSRAAVREVIEELFINETDENPGFNPFEVTDENVLYLGHWRPDARGRNVFREASRYRKQWYFFKMKNGPSVYSPRSMPDGSEKRLRVRVDAYVFVASEVLDDQFLTKLENSAYQLVTINELKSVMDQALAGRPVAGFDQANDVPKFTPDLVNIMTGAMSDELQEFAELVSRHAAKG